MSAASVLRATVRATARQQLNPHYAIDYVLRGSDTGEGRSGIPTDLAQGLGGNPALRPSPRRGWTTGAWTGSH